MIRLKYKLEPIFGIVGITIATILLILSAIHTPGYSPLKDNVSNLGYGPAKSLFSIAFVVGGSMEIPFYIYLERELSNINERVRKLATTVSLVTSVCIALVGIIPDETYIQIFRIFHDAVAFFSFIGSVVYIGLFSILMYLGSRKSTYPKLNFRKFHPILGFVIVVVLIVLLITYIPIIEWILTILILTWIFITSVYVFASNSIHIPITTLKKLPNSKLLKLFQEMRDILIELNLDNDSIIEAVEDDISIIKSRIEKEESVVSKAI
jgi:hypothetical membrane protein